MEIRNIALYAHVDSGKTSVCEQFLFHSGAIKSLGNVDKGSTQTDYLSIEKERGITVNSVVSTFFWRDTQINLIDTPGHVDFSAETELSLPIIDGAILIVSALESVQAQTEQMLYWLRKYKKPFLVFINKLDRQGADYEWVISDLEKALALPVFPLQSAEHQETEALSLSALWTENHYTSQEDLLEKVIASDTKLMERYFSEETLSFEQVDEQVRKMTASNTLVPICLGSAKFDIGIDSLLDAIVRYLPEAQQNKEANLSAIVFKTFHKKGEGKSLVLRLFSGCLEARQTVFNQRTQTEDKILVLKDTNLQKQSIVQKVEAGDMVWAQGLKDAQPGDIIGLKPETYLPLEKSRAFLSVQVRPEQASEQNALLEAMQILNNEEPDLALEYQADEQEIHIRIRGLVQQEILENQIKERFALQPIFSEPSVIYKETPSRAAYGFVRYWMPKPCWAIMRFKVEPAPRGSGVSFESEVGVNDIKQQYQNDVKKCLPEALKQGILGWQVDDVHITLVEGEDHEMHTKSNDFTIATPMGIMAAWQDSNQQLLEPIFAFKIVAPEIYLGAIISELSQRRAHFDSPEIEAERCTIKGEVPLAEFLNFPIVLAQISSGKGKLTSHFYKYEICSPDLGKTRAYKGISPLDTAKYILKARKAIQ